jgi:hypothetical protein
MKGGSFSSIWKSIKKFLGPIVSEIGPKVGKEILLPMAIKAAKKYTGMGCARGGSLKLAGQGPPKKKGKESARARADRLQRKMYAQRMYAMR